MLFLYTIPAAVYNNTLLNDLKIETFDLFKTRDTIKSHSFDIPTAHSMITLYPMPQLTTIKRPIIQTIPKGCLHQCVLTIFVFFSAINVNFMHENISGFVVLIGY